MNDLQSLLPRLLPAAATAGSAALLALALFDVFNAATRGDVREGEPLLRSRAPAPVAASATDLNRIPGWHLFGDASALSSRAAARKEIIEAPTTPLALTLQGTFLGKSSTEESWAIISSSDNAQAMYRVGDEIPGGATLFAVEPFRVILERNGRHESLALPRPSMGEAERPPSAAPRPPAGANAKPARAGAAGNAYSERQALIDEMAEIRKRFAR